MPDLAMTSCCQPSVHQRATRFLRLQFFALGLLMGGWATSLPALKLRFGFSDQAFSLVLLALAVGSAVAFVNCPRLIRLGGLSAFTRVSAVMAALAVAASFVQSAPLPLVITAFVIGFASAGFDVAINTAAVSLERSLGESIMSGLHALFSSGGVVAAISAAFIYHTARPLLWLALGAAVLMVLAVLAVAPAPTAPAAPASPLRRGFLRHLGLLRLGTAALLCLLCEGVMYDWSAVYLVHTFDASMATSVVGFGLFSTAMAGGRFTGDRLRQRCGEMPLLVAGCLLAAAGAAAAVFGGARELALAGFVLVGLGLSNVIPIVFAQAPRVHAGTPEQAIAVVSGIGFTGFLIGPPLVGLWSAAFSLDSALLLVVAACLGVALLTARRGEGV